MQYLGFILLLISAWLGYCGVQSFNPLTLFTAVIKSPTTADATIKKEQAFRDGNVPDIYAGQVYAQATDPNGSTPDSAPSSVDNLGAFEAAHLSVLNSQGHSAADVAVYQQYAADVLKSYDGKKVGPQQNVVYHYNPADVPALVKLWNIESNWNPTAQNPTSPAFGIAQADPGTKYPQGHNTSAAGQINWGLAYIMGRYGSPSAALQFETSHTPYWY